MSIIYLVRHAENVANLTKEFSHKRVDYSLTEKGILQARQTAEYFAGRPIHAVYTSPLKRAVETAEIIAKAAGAGVVPMEHFREVNMGILESQPPTPENWAYFLRIVDDWYNGKWQTRYPGGEDYFEVLRRVRSGIEQIARESMGRDSVIVSHTGIITAIVDAVCHDEKVNEVRKTEPQNCSVTVMEIETVDGRLAGRLRGWGMCGHLSGEAAELVSALPTQVEAAYYGKRPGAPAEG